jgi:hypothetical protein
MSRLLPLLLLIACGGSPEPAPADAPVEAPAGVAVSLDDAIVGHWRPGDGATPLASLLPEAARDPAGWRAVLAVGGPRTWIVTEPATAYGPAEVRLFVRDGASAIGVFRELGADLPEVVRAAAAAPATELVGVQEVRVHTQAPPPREAPPRTQLEVAGPDGATVVVDDALLASVPRPSQQRRHDQSVLLRDAIDAAVGGEWRAVALSGATELRLSRDETAGWTLKQNRRGEWLARAEAGGEVRDLRRAQVER